MLLGGGNLWALTGTEKATNTGTKDTEIKGTSYTIAGTYIAGSGAASATGMANKGVKFRTGSDGARLVFTVNTGYTITDFKLYGVSNYDLNDGASEPCIAVTKVEVDGTETEQTGTGNFPAKGASTAGSVLLSGISATQSIAIYFDNSNAKGTQINGYYEITWTAPDPEEPTGTTVSPTSGKILVGKTIQLTGAFASGNFEGEWVSDNESVATVSSTGLVTGVGEGTANITYQWVDDQSKDAFKATAAIKVYDLTFNKDALTAVKTYDFANWGATTLTIESSKAGSIWNQANKKNNDVFRCTNEGLTSLAVQAVYSSKKGWTIDATGLLEGSGAGRCAAICDVKAGQYIEFNHTSGTSFYTKNEGEDDGVNKIPLVEESGHHVYYVEEDGMVGFEMSAGKYVTSVVIYEKQTGTATSLSFSASTATATLGESFTAPTLTIEPTEAAGEVVYTSSNTAVATVDASTGEITIVGAGETTITAAISGSETYQDATASYTLKVIDANAQEVTATWSMVDGTASTGVAGADETVMKMAWNIGSKLQYNSMKTISGVKLTSFNPKEQTSTTRAGGHYVEWIMTPWKGLTFTPTEVSFLAYKCGTDGGVMSVDLIDGEGNVKQLATDVALIRDNKAGSNDTYTYTISDASASTKAVTLRIYLKSMATGKQMAVGNVVIKGTASGTAAELASYTVTTSLNIDGAGTITPALGENSVYETNDIELTATANDGYEFVNWTIDGATQTANPYTISNVNENHTAVANFKQLLSITFAAGEGIGEVPATAYADEGTTYTVPKSYYLAKSGYTLAGWSDGTNTYKAGDTFTMSSENVTLTAVFTENTEALTKSLGTATVTWDFQQKNIGEFTSATSGYFVAQATVNGTTIDVPMAFDKQIPNGSWTDWANTGNKPTLTIPAVSGMQITILTYSSPSATTIAGSTDYTVTGDKNPYTVEYTYEGTASTIDINLADAGYIRTLKVVYPKTHTYVDVTSVGYRTFASGSALDFTDGVEGLTAYRATVSGDNVSFVEIDGAVPAGEGMLLKADEGRYYIPLATGTPDAIENAFVGVTTATEVEAGIFVLMNEDGVVGFYKTKNAFTVGANTAYLPGDVAARTFIGLDDETTGISAALMNGERVNGEVYNLNGQRVAQPAKGLYIVNGKKVIINK